MRKILEENKSLVTATVVSDIVGATYAVNKFDLTQIRDALSTGQLGSKVWLVSELKKLGLVNPRILIVGGWIGSLSRIIFENFNVTKICSIDIDEVSTTIAKYVNNSFSSKFLAVTADMYLLNAYDYSDYDVIINTSCEHIPDVKSWIEKIPNGKIIIAQSNNFTACDQHINCVHSIEQFEKQFQLSEIIFSGEKTLQNLYTRYMIIGKK